MIKKEDFSSVFETNSANDFFKDFNQKGSESLAALTLWQDEINVTDSTMRAYLTDCMQKQVPASFEDYNKYVQKAITENRQLNLSTKTLNMAFQGLAMAGNMAANMAVSWIIGKAVSAIDDYVNRVDHANEAMSDAVSSYENAKSELEGINSQLEACSTQIAELKAKDKLTFAEQGELERLQNITQELLIQKDIQEKKLALEQKDAAKSAVDAYETQYGGLDISQAAVDSDIKYADTHNVISVSTGEDDIPGNLADLKKFSSLMEETKQKLRDNKNLTQEEIDALESDFQCYVDAAGKTRDNLNASVADLEEKRSAMKGKYDSILEKQTNGEYLSTDEQKVLETYEKISSIIKLIYSYNDKNAWNSMQFSDILNSSDIGVTKEELIKMAQNHTLTSDTIRNNYKKLAEEIANSEFIPESNESAVDAFIQEICAMAEEASHAGDSFYAMDTSLSNTSALISGLSDMSDKFDKINTAYQEFAEQGKDGISNDSLAEIAEAFQDVEGIDIDSFLEKLYDSSSTAEEIQDAFNQIATEIIYASSGLNTLTDTSMQKVVKELNANGIVNAEEIIEKLQIALSRENQMLNDAEQEYLNYINHKEGYDTAYLENVNSKSSQLINALGEPYKADYDNWVSLLQQKTEAYNSFVNAINSSPALKGKFILWPTISVKCSSSTFHVKIS